MYLQKHHLNILLRKPLRNASSRPMPKGKREEGMNVFNQLVPPDPPLGHKLVRLLEILWLSTRDLILRHNHSLQNNRLHDKVDSGSARVHLKYPFRHFESREHSILLQNAAYANGDGIEAKRLFQNRFGERRSR
jgi:hypothetical protein